MYKVALPIPVFSATCVIVTERSPRSETSDAVAFKTASRTSWRCAAIVCFQSLGTNASVLERRGRIRYVLTIYTMSRKIKACRLSKTGNAMTDRPPDEAAQDEAVPAAPRWVKVFAAVAIVLLLLFAVAHLAGGGMRWHAA